MSNGVERGAPPSRPQAPPAGPRGPRRLDPEEEARGRAGSRGRDAARSGSPGRDAARSGSPGREAGRGAAATPPHGAIPSDRRAVLGGATPTSRGPRRLAPPRPVRVRSDATGRPEVVSDRPVEAVRESWLVEDRWWTDAPLRRRYWEVVTADGRDLVVFRDLQEGRWYGQR
jgi:hypothetical protein